MAAWLLYPSVKCLRAVKTAADADGCDDEGMSAAAHVCTVLGRRTCALLGAGSALLHAVMLGSSANPAAGAVLGVMIVGCLFCAAHLWQRGTSAIWCTIALMNLAMVALHMPMPSHHHGVVLAGAAMPAPASAMAAVMTLAVVLALTEATIAAVVLYYRTRHTSVI